MHWCILCIYIQYLSTSQFSCVCFTKFFFVFQLIYRPLINTLLQQWSVLILLCPEVCYNNYYILTGTRHTFWIICGGKLIIILDVDSDWYFAVFVKYRLTSNNMKFLTFNTVFLGGENTVAINMIVRHVKQQLEEVCWGTIKSSIFQFQTSLFIVF